MADLVVPKVRDVSIEIPSVLTAVPTAQHAWLCAMGANLGAWHVAKSLATMQEAQILYFVQRVWPDPSKPQGTCVSEDSVKVWEGDYYRWARAFTKKQGSEPANVTIANKVSVYRDWVAEGVIDYPEYVSVRKPGINGHGVKGDVWEDKAFDPFEVDYGKLLVARGAARKGDLTPEAWTALADPRGTVQELKNALARGSGRFASLDDLRIWQQDGILYATLLGETSAFAMLLNDNIDTVPAQRGTARLLATFGAEMPDDIVPIESLSNLPMAMAAGENLVVAARGCRFLEIVEERDLVLLQDELNKVLSKRGILTQF
jgi:hypothetical protein